MKNTQVLPVLSKTLVSVGAVVSAATASGSDFTYVQSKPITLDSTGDKWYIDGSSSGDYFLSADAVSSSTFWFNLNNAKASGVELTFAYTSGLYGSQPMSFVNSYTSGTSIFDGSTSQISFGAFETQYIVFDSDTMSNKEFKNFSSTNSGYAAFTFTMDSTAYYGWAYFTFENVGVPSVTITEWAYTSDSSIYVGQTSVVPEPAETAGGLGLLVLGAAGMSRYMKNRKMKVA